MSDWVIRDFQLTEYQTVWQWQKSLVRQRLAGEIPDTILIGEHPPIVTLGRGTHDENLLNPSIPTVAIERGGDVTYHGPGQLIAYPIVMLPEGKRDLHRYLRDLEAAIILTLGDFGIEGLRNPGWTGVWAQSPQSLDQQSGELLKLASIGVAVKQWVTYHGLALNVCTDLAAFSQINPCGLQSEKMTSMQALLQQPIAVADVKPVLARHLQTLLQAP